MKEQTIKKYAGEKSVKQVNERLEEFWNSNNGFLIIVTTDGSSKIKITDFYKGFCKKCALEVVEATLEDAEKLGLLAKGK